MSKLLFLSLTLSVVILSCTKGTKPDISPSPYDTLTTGWTQIANAGFFNATDVFFKSNTTGYISTNGAGVFKSTDGGNTWNEIPAATGRPSTSINISVTNDGKAFFIGPNNDSIFRTTDNGLSFNRYFSNADSLYDIFFADNNLGLCTSKLGLLKTMDGGTSWNNISPLPEYNAGAYSSLFMYGNTNAWICYNNKVFHANGDLSVFRIDSVPSVSPNLYLTSVFAISPTVVYAASYSGYIFKSVDGGNTFSYLNKLEDNYSAAGTDIQFLDANTGYASVGTRIYKTTDAGATWNVVVALRYGQSISEIHFTDASHGWAVYSGVVLKYN